MHWRSGSCSMVAEGNKTDTRWSLNIMLTRQSATQPDDCKDIIFPLNFAHSAHYYAHYVLQSSIALLPVDQSTPALYYNPASNTTAVRHYFYLLYLLYLIYNHRRVQTAGPNLKPNTRHAVCHFPTVLYIIIISKFILLLLLLFTIYDDL